MEASIHCKCCKSQVTHRNMSVFSCRGTVANIFKRSPCPYLKKAWASTSNVLFCSVPTHCPSGKIGIMISRFPVIWGEISSGLAVTVSGSHILWSYIRTQARSAILESKLLSKYTKVVPCQDKKRTFHGLIWFLKGFALWPNGNGIWIGIKGS